MRADLPPGGGPALRARAVHDSPLGPLTLEADAGRLVRLSFAGRTGGCDPNGRRMPVLTAAAAQLGEYLAGTRRAFDVPLATGGTPFQRRVWAEVRRIPYGATTTYAALAAAVGRPDIVRAVAAAVGRTPVPIVIPCHRVVAASGALTGYAGGVARKQALLDLERRVLHGGPPEPAWRFRQLALL